MHLKSNSALWNLSDDERIKVAESAHTNINALEELAHDDSVYVRYSVRPLLRSSLSWQRRITT